jgi:hypothetical protein
MPSVTSSTGTLAPVRIDSPNTLIRPAGKNGERHTTFSSIPGLDSLYLNHRAVAVETGIRQGFIVRGPKGCLHALERLNTVYRVNKTVVNRIVLEVAVGVVHEVLAILLLFDWMTCGTVLGSDHNMDLKAIVFKGVLMIFGINGVAFGTPNGNTFQSLRDFFKGDPPLFYNHASCGPWGNPGHAASLPVFNNSWSYGSVAFNAGLCLFT